MKNMQRIFRTVATTAIAGSLCMAVASAATIGAGVVTDNGLRLRSEPNTSSRILDLSYKNETVIVLEKADNNWYKVSYDAQTGYMSGDYLKIYSVSDTSLGNGKVEADGSVLRLRGAAGLNGTILTTIPDQTVLELEGISNGWYKVTYNGKTGYASSDYIEPVSDDYEVDSSSSASNAVSNSGASNAAVSTNGSAIVAYAKQFLGVKYVYGGSTPSGFDCSGFTQYVMRHFGYSINRTASTQLKNGTAVSRSDLQPGDLIFFRQPGSSYAATHVGIYIGDNQFIHASTNDYTVRIDSLNSSWYSKIFTAARRIAS